MTALPPEPAVLNFLQKRIGPTYVEMFHERPYPLDVSGWLQFGLFDMLGKMAAASVLFFHPSRRSSPKRTAS